MLSLLAHKFYMRVHVHAHVLPLLFLSFLHDEHMNRFFNNFSLSQAFIFLGVFFFTAEKSVWIWKQLSQNDPKARLSCNHGLRAAIRLITVAVGSFDVDKFGVRALRCTDDQLPPSVCERLQPHTGR